MSLMQIAIIMIIALILFGPEDLPVFARALGKTVYNIRKFANEITKEFKDVIDTPTNMVNDVLKEPNKEKITKEKSFSEEKSPSEKESDDREELLTYEDNKLEEKPKTIDTESNYSNPLSDLPADVVTYPKDKQAGE
ncbi:MAG: hypothetical protein APF84_18105 [Gracilibacter sp. BRH_c7a]|nr:MAG: hypothetical protein APF84_18105 [Gracilibacter sp. BRH_c7a]